VTDARPNIWRLQSQSDVDGLIKALENSDPDIRLRAAIALRALSATSAISPIRARLAIEDNAEVRTNLTQVLVFLLEEHEERSEQQKSPPPDETALLVSQLKSKNNEDVIHAAQALGALGDPIAVEPLIILFDNGAIAADVRLAAAEALIELKSTPTSVTALVALRRPDWHIRRIAAAMLGHLEADWAIEPLRKALTDENELVRRTARAALKHIGTPEALKAAESIPEEQPSSEAQSPTMIAVASPVRETPAEAPTPAPTATTSTTPQAGEKTAAATPPPAAPTPEPETSSPVQTLGDASLTTPPAEVVSATAQTRESKTVASSATEAASPTEQPPADNEPKPQTPETQPAVPDATPKVEATKESAAPLLSATPIPASSSEITATTDALVSSDGASSAKQNSSQQ
jgi:HEAT repeat protein